MSKRKSQSGPCRVIATFTPQPLDERAQRIVDGTRRTVAARRQADKEIYEQSLKLKGLRRQ